MAIIRRKTGLPHVDRPLEDIWRRLDALERRRQVESEGDCCEDGATGATGPTGPAGAKGALTYSVGDISTTAARRWLSVGSANLQTTLGVGWVVPPGFTKIVSMSIFVLTAGSGAATVTYTATVGNVSSETDSTITTTLASTFNGSTTVSGSATVAAGDVIRLAVTKSVNMVTSHRTVSVLLTLEP